MGVLSSPDPSETSPAERFRRLRELGSCPVPVWAALEALPDGRTRLVVVEQVPRGGDVDDGEIADWVRDAQRLATLEHPNVARVRDVVIGKDDVVVVSDFVDGVRWGELASGPQPVPLEIALRVFVDALSGLSAIHNVRNAKREPLKLVHGGLTTDCVVVGTDGVSRIVAASRVRSSTRPANSGSAYLAPEVLLGDDAADARADVYSIGAMLWEALSGRPLFPNTQPSAIVTALLSGRVPRAEAPKGAPWALPLVELVTRALSVDPDKRFASASAMAAELRRVAGVKLVPSLRVAALVRAGFGERVKARREELERGEVAPRGPARVQAPEVPVELEGPSSSEATSVPPDLLTTRPPPPPVETATAFDSVPVVMSSEPPTQPRVRAADGSTEAGFPAAMAVPAAPPVPRELAATAKVPIMVETPPAPAPVPARGVGPVPSVFATEAQPVFVRRGRLVVYAAVAGTLVVALAGLLVWLGLRGPAQSDAPAPAALGSVAPSPPAPPTPSDEPKSLPLAEAPTLAPPIASASATPTEGPTASAAAAATSPAPPPPTPAKPRPVIKYDPQGI